MRLHTKAVERAFDEKGVTAKFVAAKLGVSESSLSRYISCRRECPDHVFRGLVRFFEVSPATFMGPEDPEKAIAEAAAAFGINGARLEELHRQHGFTVAA